MPTQRERIERIRISSDAFEVSSDGELLIDGLTAKELLRRFDSPLFVLVERTLRTNLRRIRAAFASQWPKPVNVMYAIKANNNPAVRAVLNSEGAGGECFGLGELRATFLGGANPASVVMNGSNKSEEELSTAVEHGVLINIDAESEIETLARVCKRLGQTARVNLRLKIVPDCYASVGSDYFGLSTNVRACLLDEKWGFSAKLAKDLVEHIRSFPALDLRGFSAHTGRFTRDPGLFREYTRELAATVTSICDDARCTTQILDIGGGWPRERDPESRLPGLNPHPIEEYAREAIAGLKDGWGAHLAYPELWLEPGRYIVGNASFLLGTIGTIKRDCDRVWVHSDFSTNHLMRIDTAASSYHVIVATGMDRPDCQTVQIVGPTCVDSRFAAHLSVPDVRMGEPIAVLDTGMYSETTSTQFNGTPRPATVLVSNGEAEVIKKRETVGDLFQHCLIPNRLKPRER